MDIYSVLLMIIYYSIINIGTAWVYYIDKRRAKRVSWRIPEITLLALGLFGGWIGAFIAQQEFRHKINLERKWQFILWFWFTVAVNVWVHICHFDIIEELFDVWKNVIYQFFNPQ